MSSQEIKGPEKKWSEAAERDLLIAMLCANSTGGSVKANWTVVATSMKAMGYDFTESAISQKFGKTIIKDFRKRFGEDCVVRFSAGASGGSSAASTPRKNAASGASSNASKRKKAPGFTPVNNTSSKGTKTSALSGKRSPGSGASHKTEDLDSPSKRLKLAPDASLITPPVYRNDQPVGWDQFFTEAEA